MILRARKPRKEDSSLEVRWDQYMAKHPEERQKWEELQRRLRAHLFGRLRDMLGSLARGGRNKRTSLSLERAWRDAAAAAWNKNRKLSIHAVAKIISRRQGGGVRTITERIKDLKPKK